MGKVIKQYFMDEKNRINAKRLGGKWSLTAMPLPEYRSLTHNYYIDPSRAQDDSQGTRLETPRRDETKEWCHAEPVEGRRA